MAPLADPQVPMTRAAMAAIVGAQMMSAFDTSGSYFGETGAFSPWWTAATLSQWNSRGACFVAQYSAFHVGDAAVDGLATLASNAGDLAGVSLSYQLFQSDPWPQTTAQHRSSAQQFFVSFVAPACEAATNAYYVDEIEQADDVPFPFSVQGALSNLPDFARAFQCGAQSVYGRSQTNLVCSMF
jgi:endothelin-converting enzyme/putative endopeptidase